MIKQILRPLKSKVFKILSERKRLKYGYMDSSACLEKNTNVYEPKNLYMYERTNIDEGARIMNSRTKFIMKKNSGAAVGLLVITGNHLRLIGTWLRDVTDEMKNQIDVHNEYDRDVTVDEDVWIGAHVTLTSGVHICRGATIGAGAVVRGTIPPYAVAIGNPARIVAFNYTPEEAVEHEKALYAEDERIPFEILEKNYNKYFVNRIKEIKSFTKN